MTAILDAALEYAAAGLHVLPLRPRDRIPATRRGFYDATSNPATIRRWFRFFPYNIGVRTGATSGCWVLDIDGVEGKNSLAHLIGQHGPLPATARSLTARGFHLWFRYDQPIPNTVGRIAPGIDTRGDNAYATAPPSIHPTGAQYCWCDDSPDTLVAAPDWLIQLTRARPRYEHERPHVRRDDVEPGRYGQTALDAECRELASTPAGQRNNQLNRAAFVLHQLVAGGELAEEAVAHALMKACETNGLAKDDGWSSVKMTIRSGARAGLKHPRARS